MSDKKDKRVRADSNTDFFLKIVKKEQEERKSQNEKKVELEERKTKTINIFFEVFNTINKMLDRMLNSKHSLRFISLILTLVLFFTFSGGDVLTSTTSGKTIKNVPVRVEGLADGYEVSGLPSSVNVGLIGPSLDIYTEQVKKDYQVYVNLSEYKQGNHTVTYSYRNFSKNLTVMVMPETASISIAPKVSKSFKVEPKFINEDKLDERYAVSVNSLSKERVNVYASKATLNKIDHIVAEIDVANRTKAFTAESVVKAVDSNGKKVNCTISPTKIKAECSVDTYSKVVAVKPQFTGNLKKGYKLTSYVLSPSTVTIYGSRSDIDDISSVACKVDISKLAGSTTISGIKLEMNDTISKMSVDSITISMTIEKE
ncbi:MAG TPA: hypothetical protein DIC33_03770 [Kandleria vitulina]|uniref:CdaR family protein n=1 Tax=Kandleria vitulina TaxID=1630 RepID=UPI000E8C2025|nr:hypothetical protein [Kandleria vitulina]HCY53195.1 hypothetical protein [Kandleria vitulina]